MNATELDAVVARVQAGDREAFGELVFAIRRDLRVYLSTYASSIDMVEEIVQATLVTAYEQIGKYERRGTFLAWAKGISRNLVLKELHARSRYVEVTEDGLERIVVREALAAAERDHGQDPEADLARLQSCLQRLPAEARDLVQKRYFDRMSLRSIAQLLNRTETWVAVSLFRIREELRDGMLKEVAP